MKNTRSRTLHSWAIRLALVIYDIVAVNVSYYIALMVRFYVNHEFHDLAAPHLANFVRFAPWYTILCIAIFAAFKLYNGLWRYAGLSDVNRIVYANLGTFLVQVFGTALFMRRMPITYYVIGAIIQFVLIFVSRFSYRFFADEFSRFARGKSATSVNTIVIGAGESARIFLRTLENDKTNILHPVCIVDERSNERGRFMDGIPVVGGAEGLEKIASRFSAKCVVIADPLMPAESRKAVKTACEKLGVELRDFSGYSAFSGASVSLKKLMEYANGPVEVTYEGVTKSYQNGEEAVADLPGKYIVKSVEAKAYALSVEITTDSLDEDPEQEAWLRDYEKKTGESLIPFSPPDISDMEIAEVCAALKSGWITTGPRTKLLERRLAAYIATGRTDVDCTTPEAIEKYSNRVACLNSATAAEELNLRVLGVGPGDEVIVPAYTYTASASAAIHCGATVKFVDIQKDGDPVTHMPEMDYDKLEEAINEKTKAVITVDLGGIVCDYERVFEIVERKRELFVPKESDGTPLGDLSSRIQKKIGRVAVVSDCAHALGASREIGGERRYCGNIADFTSFSFHAVKNFTTAEGGASTWLALQGIEDPEIYHMYQLLSLHGQNKDALAKTKVGAWEYDIIGPWYKCNMTDIMAAIGLRQLDRYRGLLDRRVEIMKKYDQVCEELGISHMVHHVPGMDSSNHLYLIRVPGITVEQRNEIIEKMAKAGVSTNVHYKPLPMMTAYKNLGWKINDFPNTYDYYHNLLTLPFHTLLTDADVDHVCDVMREVIPEFM